MVARQNLGHAEAHASPQLLEAVRSLIQPLTSATHLDSLLERIGAIATSAFLFFQQTTALTPPYEGKARRRAKCRTHIRQACNRRLLGRYSFRGDEVGLLGILRGPVR